MATSTQYNPNRELNSILLAAGCSKTVYALVTPEIEAVKDQVFGDMESPARTEYLDQFREAWTGKQDAYHDKFFTTWHQWASPVVKLLGDDFPFYYPTAGASEPIRQLIFSFATKGGQAIHVFEGEYEGYRAMAEAAGLKVVEHPRDGKEGWHTPFGLRLNRIASNFTSRDLFFISQPSAIDGNVWLDFNEFISKMPDNSVVVDLTYVGAVPEHSIKERFDMTQLAIRNIVFSLSKPFGTYYDRIGGVLCREEDLGLFGNKWFKGLTALSLGTALMEAYDVFHMPTTYGPFQRAQTVRVGKETGIHLLEPSDVFLLATGTTEFPNVLADYLMRAGKVRVCLTPGMAKKIGDAR